MPASGLKRLLLNKQTRSCPASWIPSLYLIEGLPNAVVATLSVILLKDMGVNNAEMALFTSLLYLPWVIKPFWAPFVDILMTKRRWILLMQAAMGAGMTLVAVALPGPDFLKLSLAAFWGVAFCSATHDIAADGFYMLALTQKDQAFYVGIRSTFYRLANLAASGGVVYLAGRMIRNGISVSSAWSTMFVGLSAFFFLSALYHSFILPRPTADVSHEKQTVGGIVKDFGTTLVTFFTKPDIGVAIAFMLLYRLPEALLGKMVQPFLKDPVEYGGLGLTTEQIGIANGTFGVIGIVAGGIVGGICISCYGLRRMLWPMALSLTLPSAFYCYLAIAQPQSLWLISGGLLVEQFGYGFGFTAYMMYLIYFCSNTSYSTSHYAFCTGIMALGLMLPGMIAGKLQESVGYIDFFALVMASCLATFAVCAIVKIDK
ncbi:MAG: MFS transporter [Muribaculaceae bacterium]|nr:MFS transporter [Muribaculaceae bacterium]